MAGTSKQRIAVIDRNVCIKEKCGYACSSACPVNRMGQECIVVEKDSKFPAISETLCIGCGICPKKCPVNCIAIINLASEIGSPIYQYGINAFRLYGLPLPQEGGAMALIGKNGIGKTTAIKLLTKQLKPNFGEFKEERTDAEIAARLPIETRRYFQRIGTEIKASSKPQQIDRVRDAFKGTVRDLIKSVSEKNATENDEILRLFNIEAIKDREVKHLSGGELQRVAIAAAYMKDADIYYFDEPTNYLDIEERLRVAVNLKNLAESKMVVLAEHDLTVLDYVSAYVNVFYGAENTYGIVSGMKNIRAGINEYIGGFLKEENVRFREYEIKFVAHSEGEAKTSRFINYGKLGKTFKEFSLTCDAGDIRKGEIVGIVGKNALGKTVFTKMLAGLEKPDNGNVAIDIAPAGRGVGRSGGDGGQLGALKVSYKPQYISASPVQVREIFEKENINGTLFENAKRKLSIGMLMEKKLDELSGGELQRVAITLALCREADIYLFDEPSAFLDIEQRFLFAELLRFAITDMQKAAFVVDHDIVFVDSIANRLIVFDGEPSVKGHAGKPMDKREGMNAFLRMAGVTMRRDKDSKRPRINKPGSALDMEQKEAGNFYY
ncbi:MAG: ribosome biogenesis/translation initiation ATPase RLI [Candidatus Bilamarchaeaceae archaeon]